MSFTQKVLVLLLLIVAKNSFAACSGNITGQSSKLYIDISDGGCDYNEEMIQVFEIDPDSGASGDKKISQPFAKECRFANKRNTLTCRANGKTILAGTEYKRTFDVNPICGEAQGSRLTCIKGCKKDVPKYLNESPYEC